MAESRIPTMTHLVSFLVILLWITEGESFSVYPISKRNNLAEERFPVKEESKFKLNKKELCLLKNCVAFKGLEFASCYLACSDENINENDVADEDSHFRRQVDPLQSCIEAKCLPGFSYTDCVYSQCIMGLRLGYKHFQKKRTGWAAAFPPPPSFARNEKRGAEKSLQRMRKKSWNDPSDACISFHCGGKSPGSMVYSICVNTQCGSSYER